VFAVIYVIIAIIIPTTSLEVTIALLSNNAPMAFAILLIFTIVLDVTHKVERGNYWIAIEAYIALFTSLLLFDLVTVLLASVATEVGHLFTRASFIIGGCGILDGLVLIPTEAVMAALIAAAITRRPRNT
jgi:hypothetical protein